MEVASAGRPDGSGVIASNADSLPRTRESCHYVAVGGHVRERQAAVSRPYGTFISRSDAEFVLLRMWKPHGA